jgi:cardiolipin synthase (CMP-forming)
MITVASCITLLRILLTPFVIYYIHLQTWSLAALFFVIAAATDLVDGFIARRFNQQSSLGQLLDPLADKCLIMGTLYTLLMIVAANFWQNVAVWFLLTKEIILLGGGAWLKLRYNFFITPSVLSRAASLAEIFLILFLFVSLIFYGYIPTNLFSVLLSINICISVWLLMRYVLIINKKVF